MPYDDWQFYVVTLAALAGAWLIVRPFLGSRKGSGGCPSCSDGKTRPKRTKLTIDGR